MPTRQAPTSGIKSFPVTTERWNDLERLFGPRGACEDCWCMWWRLARAEFTRLTAGQRREALKRLVDTGQAPGILAYKEEVAIAWCAVAPRDAYPALQRSRTLKPVDDHPAWSVVCFFVHRDYRRQGLMIELLRAAVAYAASRGALIVEGYPVEPPEATLSGSGGYMGIVSVFLEAGFVEVARRSARHPVMRYVVA
jgi:GNAT superfamily N-acetyltransferase